MLSLLSSLEEGDEDDEDDFAPDQQGYGLFSHSMEGCLQAPKLAVQFEIIKFSRNGEQGSQTKLLLHQVMENSRCSWKEGFQPSRKLSLHQIKGSFCFVNIWKIIHAIKHAAKMGKVRFTQCPDFFMVEKDERQRVPAKVDEISFTENTLEKERENWLFVLFLMFGTFLKKGALHPRKFKLPSKKSLSVLKWFLEEVGTCLTEEQSYLLILISVEKEGTSLFAHSRFFKAFFYESCLQLLMTTTASCCSVIMNDCEGEGRKFSLCSLVLTGYPDMVFMKDVDVEHAHGHPKDQACKLKGPVVHAGKLDAVQDTLHVAQGMAGLSPFKPFSFEKAVEKDFCLLPKRVQRIFTYMKIASPDFKEKGFHVPLFSRASTLLYLTTPVDSLQDQASLKKHGPSVHAWRSMHLRFKTNVLQETTDFFTWLEHCSLDSAQMTREHPINSMIHAANEMEKVEQLLMGCISLVCRKCPLTDMDKHGPRVHAGSTTKTIGHCPWKGTPRPMYFLTPLKQGDGTPLFSLSAESDKDLAHVPIATCGMTFGPCSWKGTKRPLHQTQGEVLPLMECLKRPYHSGVIFTPKAFAPDVRPCPKSTFSQRSHVTQTSLLSLLVPALSTASTGPLVYVALESQGQWLMHIMSHHQKGLFRTTGPCIGRPPVRHVHEGRKWIFYLHVFNSLGLEIL